MFYRLSPYLSTTVHTFEALLQLMNIYRLELQSVEIGNINYLRPSFITAPLNRKVTFYGLDSIGCVRPQTLMFK